MIRYVAKLWKRREYVAKALANWGLYFADVVTFRNKGSHFGKKTVIFARAISDIRLFKEAKSLKNTGQFYTIFFTKVINRNLMRPAFDEIYPLFSVERMVNKIKSIGSKSDILAIHVSSPPANICRRLIEMNLPWPVIFDQYDSWMVTVGPDYKGDSSERMYDLRQQIEDEKFCYENADGVISKTTELDYVKSILNVKCPTLVYPDYALEDWFVEPAEPIRTADGRPHLVYAGAVHGKSDSDDLGYSKFFDFARNLNRQRIHFHIYPNPGQTIAANDYKQLNKELEFFHFHKSKKPWEIQKEITRYDFALDVAWTEKATGLREEKAKTATGIKFGTYLEAGLPIIANSSKCSIAQSVARNEIGFIIEGEGSILSDESLQRRNFYKNNSINYRSRFCCGRHVKELVELYEKAQQN